MRIDPSQELVTLSILVLRFSQAHEGVRCAGICLYLLGFSHIFILSRMGVKCDFATMIAVDLLNARKTVSMTQIMYPMGMGVTYALVLNSFVCPLLMDLLLRGLCYAAVCGPAVAICKPIRN